MQKPAFFGGFFLLSMAACVALLMSVWLLFSGALPGIVHFDDLGNLQGLQGLKDAGEAWRWLQEGMAGPLGRPLALATFALQAHEWPEPAAFLRWNIGLHAINSLLVFWLAFLLAGRMGTTPQRQLALGFFTALTWALLPLLNTSVLFIVQRMTLLSASFVLLGLIAYLKLRGPVDAPWSRQFVALVAAAIAGGLALLAKESGALIVVYVLVLEVLLLTMADRNRPSLAAWLLILANVALLAVLLPHAFWTTCTEQQRGFDMLQRLGSQAGMLLLYVKGLFLPVASELNPFRFMGVLQDLQLSRWTALGWMLLMALPPLLWVLAGRRGERHRAWQLSALALAWFLYGHIMESGWVALEPYFAHRNYLPAMGLVFLLVYAVFSIRVQARLWRAAFIAYVLVLATVSWMNTSLWGNRSLAAEIWAKEEPANVRAALNLAYDLESTQGLGLAQHYLDDFMQQRHDSPGLRLQRLISACNLNPEGEHAELVQDVIHAIQTLPYEGWASDQVEKLMDITRRQGCKDVGMQQIAEIATAFLQLPVYQCNRNITHNLLSVHGFVALDGGRPDVALDFFVQALEHSSSYAIANFSLDLAQKQGDHVTVTKLHTLLKDAGRPSGATTREWHDLLERIRTAARGTASQPGPHR